MFILALYENQSEIRFTQATRLPPEIEYQTPEYETNSGEFCEIIFKTAGKWLFVVTESSWMHVNTMYTAEHSLTQIESSKIQSGKTWFNNFAYED